jgi:hypothetical protein
MTGHGRDGAVSVRPWLGQVAASFGALRDDADAEAVALSGLVPGLGGGMGGEEGGGYQGWGLSGGGGDSPAFLDMVRALQST